MGGNSDKTSGGTRNYASQPGTLRNRKAEYRRFMGSGEYDKNKSIFTKVEDLLWYTMNIT